MKDLVVVATRMLLNEDLMTGESICEWLYNVGCGKVEDETEGDADGKCRQCLAEYRQQYQRET